MRKILVFSASFYNFVAGIFLVYMLTSDIRFMSAARSLGAHVDVLIILSVIFTLLSAGVSITMYDETALGKMYFAKNRTESFMQFLTPALAGIFTIVWMYQVSKTGIVNLIVFGNMLGVLMGMGAAVFIFSACHWLRIFVQDTSDRAPNQDEMNGS